VLHVTNTGRVIPPQLDRLFQPFQRLDAARTTTKTATASPSCGPSPAPTEQRSTLPHLQKAGSA
jgi:hypothetical protein